MEPKFQCFVPQASWFSLLPYGKVLCHAGKGIVCHQLFLDGWEKLLSEGGLEGLKGGLKKEGQPRKYCRYLHKRNVIVNKSF